MNFSVKIMLLVGMLTLCLTLASGVNAQNSSLTSVNSPTTNNLNSVSIALNLTQTNNDLTSLNAWAVGDSGTIIKWDGASWATQTSPTTDNLYSVCMVNATVGWAVGGTSNNGVILNYNGSNWTLWKQISFSTNTTAQDKVNATLYSVTLNQDGTVGWAVGAGGTVLAWDGMTWYGVSNVTTTTLRAVAMIHGSPNAWAVGDNGTIISWNGATWSNMNSPTTNDLYALTMYNATTAWAAGGNATNGVILNLDGATWNAWTKINFAANRTANPNDKINATLYSISLNNATSAWLVGANGTVLYWDGNEWDGQTGVASGTNFKAVAMVHGSSNGSTQAWAVGAGGKIFAWTGTQWIPEIPLIAVPIVFGVGLIVALLKKRKLSTPL